MNILVCGAQAPFTRGGAELHMENLVAALRAAGHAAELVRLPVAWDKERLFDAPLAWRLIPADADLVIATNFPSYYVRHPNKVVWLFHQHRSAYDAADLGWSDIGLDDQSLEVQRLIAEWDTKALGEAKHIFTTSKVVADRLERFNGLTGEPLYHPPPLHDRLRAGPYGDYVFCPTRLERNKRPQLLAEAAASITSGTRAVIAGTGTMRDELLGIASRTGTTDRLSLLGHVSDDELVDLYAGCLGAVYVPFDEDYGYVTLQAFFAAKPVITSKDSGGVLEWVEEGKTGFITDGTPAAIAQAIDELAARPELAAKMGEAGRRKVADLSWQSVVNTLLRP